MPLLPSPFRFQYARRPTRRPWPLLALLLWRLAALAKAHEFMTLTALESSFRNMARLLLAPAFNGRSEVQLEDTGSLASTCLEPLRRSNGLLSQTLGELSAGS